VRGAALVLLALLAAASAAGGTGTPSVGAPAPPLAFTALDGTAVRLADLRGRVVLVNAWATWCPPCREEMPALEAAFRAHRDQGLVVIGLSADWLRERRAVAAAAHAISYPVALLAETTPRWEMPSALPTSWLIDRTGRVRAVLRPTSGGLRTEDLEAALAPLLAEPEPPP
jgi:peroxiredoxin